MASTKHINLKGTAQTSAMRRQLKDLAKETREAANAARTASERTSTYGQSLNTLRGSVGNVTKLLGAAGLTLGIREAVRGIDALMERSLQYQNVAVNLSFAIDKAQRSTRYMVGAMDLMTAANQASALGVARSAEEFADFAEIAVKLGARVNVGPTKAISDFTTAMGRASPRIADNLGLLIDQTIANAKYAAAIGKNVNALTEEETKLAFRNEMMRQGLELTKDVTLQEVGLAAAYRQAKTWAMDDVDTFISGEKERQAQIRITRELVTEVLQMQLADSEADARNLGAQLDRYRMLGLLLKDYTAPSVEQLANEYVRMKESADAGYETIAKLFTDSRSLTQMATDALTEYVDKLKEAADKASRSQLDSLYVTEEYRTSAASRAVNRAKRDKARRKRGRGGGGGDTLYTPTGADLDAMGMEMEGGAGARTAYWEEQVAAMREFEEAKAEVQLETRMRAIEMAREQGADPIQLIEAEKEARLEYLDFMEREAQTDADRMRIQNDREQTLHEARLARIKEIEKREADHARHRQMISATIEQAALGTAAVIEAGARAAGRGEAVAHAIAMGILIAVESARAAASAAAQDWPGFTSHTTAAVLAGIAEAEALAEASGARGGGGRPEMPRLGQGGGPSPGGPGGGGPTGGGGGDEKVPLSPRSKQQSLIGGGLGLGVASGGGGGGTVIVNVTGTYVGSSEQAKIELTRVVREAQRSLGRQS